MMPRTFSPIILQKNPVEIPKVVKQDYSLENYIGKNHFEEDGSSSSSSCNTDDYEDDDEDGDGEEDEDDEVWKDANSKDEYLNDLQIGQNKQPVVTKRSSTPPIFLASSYNANDYMNKMTLDLMMNPHYLSKANPEAFQKKIEQAQRILKHRREIYKTMGDCFEALEHLTSGKQQDEIDLDVQTGFLHFAKTVLLNIQQQHAGKSGTEPIFSVCNDIHSSFYPDKNDK